MAPSLQGLLRVLSRAGNQDAAEIDSRHELATRSRRACLGGRDWHTPLKYHPHEFPGVMNVLSSRCSTSFANDVVQQLRDNAHELSKEPGIKASCSELAAELANVQHRLEELADAPSNAAEECRVLKLLDNLERLCQVGSAAY
jgi:hypothetical protein